MEFKIKPQADVNVYVTLGFDENLIDAFSDWRSKEGRYLVILDKKKVIQTLNISNQSNLILKEIDELINISKTLSEIFWQFIFLKIELVVSPAFSKNEKMVASYVVQNWQKINSGVHLSASYFADYKLPDLNTVMQNIDSKLEFSILSNLKGFFKKTPAVICGAGPSLDSSFLQMREKALIFSGGSALNALSIKPHFIGLIDRETPLEFFQKDFDESILFSLLKAPTSILKKNFKKNFLCFPKESYLFFQWIVKSIKLDFDKVDIGWSTVTFLTSLAIYFGCDPIIFNGVDLSFKDQKIYADEVVQASYKRKDNKDFIVVKNMRGDLVKTQRDWFMSAVFLQKLTDSNLQTTFYNTASNGLFLGENVKFFSMDEMKNWPSINLSEKMNHLLSKTSIKLNKNLNYQILNLIDDELKFTETELLELEKMYNGDLSALNTTSISWCRENVLMVLWDVFRHILLRNEAQDESYSFKEKVKKVLFFRDVLLEHKEILGKYFNV